MPVGSLEMRAARRGTRKRAIAFPAIDNVFAQPNALIAFPRRGPRAAGHPDRCQEPSRTVCGPRQTLICEATTLASLI